MRYNEKYINTATSVKHLISILIENVPMDAYIEIDTNDNYSNAEVWYDEGTDTVILK